MKVGEYGGSVQAQSIGSLIGDCLKEMGLSEGMNAHRIFEAWNSVSGAARHTIGHYFKGGTLYIRLSSSVVRSELYRRLNAILDGINSALADDPMFTGSPSDTRPVKKIILQ